MTADNVVADLAGPRQSTAQRIGPALTKPLSFVTHVTSLLVLLAAVSLSRLPSLDDPFHGDDYVAFTEFKTTSFIEFSKDTFLFDDANFYWRPLGQLFHRLLYEGFGLDSFVFRVAGLAVFLTTLAAAYMFCLRERLGTFVAFLSVSAFAFLPNHVVSVTWVTNTSRLLALLFLVLCLLALQTPKGRWAILREISAWLLFLAAVLSDETTLALAPVPLVYGAFLRDDNFKWRASGARILAYAGPVAVLLPIQLAETLNDEPRLASYGLGAHIITQIWALTSQLALPLATTKPIDLMFSSISEVQWGVGLATIGVGCLLFGAGSRTLRFFIFWTAISLAPFALWDLNHTSPRYVYLAALPFAVALSWGIVAMVSMPFRLILRWPRWPRLITGTAFASAVTAAFIGSVVFLSSTVQLRIEAWGQETAKYGVLAENLEARLPVVKPGARIIILNAKWPNFWASAVAKTVYGDRSIRVIGILPEHVDLPRPAPTRDDVVLNFTGDDLVPADLTARPR